MHTKLLTVVVIGLLLIQISAALAAPTQDDTSGMWADSYSDSAGISSASNVAVDGATGTLKLTNAAGGFSPPYNATGYVITTTIIPQSVARWGVVSWAGNSPEATTIKVQVLDEANYSYPDNLLPGNTNGFQSSPANLSELSVTRTANSDGAAKFARLRIKIMLSTADVNVTPQVDSLSLSWTVKRGDFSPSPLASTGWSVQDADARATRKSLSLTDTPYLTLRWVKDQAHDLGGMTTRGSRGLIFNKTLGGFIDLSTSFQVSDAKLSAVNARTGATLWARPISGASFSDIAHTLTQNGTLYISDIFNDILFAYDTVSATLKWTYQFYSGHGNSNVMVGADGTIYTVRIYGADDGFIVWAFNPNGSVKWASSYDPPDRISCSQMSIGPDGKLYMVTRGVNAANEFTGGGTLFAFNPGDGSIAWQYPTGDVFGITPLVDSSGTIYVANTEHTSSQKSIFAINPDGTLKWRRSIGVSTDSWSRLALRPDGLLLADRRSLYPSTDRSIEAVATDMGALVWAEPVAVDKFSTELFSDAANGFFVATSPGGPEVGLHYYDSAHNLRWTLRKLSTSTMAFRWFMQDDDGWVYGNLTNFDSQNNVLLALSPWKLSVAPPGTFAPGDNVTFQVTTAMQPTSPLDGRKNQVQVVLDTGDVVPLTYTSTESLGVTRWVGDYRLPESIGAGPHNFTAEANAAGIKTDVAVRFSTPAPDSNNTGVTAGGAFTVATR
ncbi:MAG TPA: PQQ-binding-like beta-propeller repeat protein [Blastocatellia bacterium]|nr:PQQ-binding-like beta-propeller repeat protein [Blastocatellia bacterium]